MSEAIIQFVINALTAAVILLAGIWLAKKFKTISVIFMEKRGIDPLIARFAGNIGHIVLIVVVVIAALSQLGIQTTSLIAIVGAAGLAIGLALQGSLANFASGVILITFRPFRVGDYIEAGGVSGMVESIEIFSTLLKTPDNKEVTVPNSRITENAITNYAIKPTRRVDLKFGISYADDIRAAKQLILDTLQADPRVLDEPAAIVAVAELADTAASI
jgi:small conductance mechanosensitive channel